MKNLVNTYVDQFRQDRQKQLKLVAVLAALAVLVAGLVFWQLRNTGVAMTNEVFCGQEEHIHDDGCYEEVLTCDEEHEHGDECYELTLVCEIPEHTHTIDCLIDENADVETASDWEATLPGELSGTWADNVVAIAESQVGYTESENNFQLAGDGETRMGYTRYGAWYGNEYGDWDAMFVSFCLNYAGVPENEIPENSGAWALCVALDEEGLYVEDAEFKAESGDLVFFDEDEDGRADHVGIIEEIITGTNEETGEETVVALNVIEGNCDDAVCETTYNLEDAGIIGYGVLPEEPDTEEDTFEVDGIDETEALSVSVSGTEVIESTTKASGSNTYSASDGGVDVTVVVPEGALPEGAELCVTLFDEESEEFADAAQAVGFEDSIETLSAEGENEDQRGMLAFDISFMIDGEEVEPSENVSVTVDASDMIPDDVYGMAVVHLQETETGVEPVQLASGDGADGTMDFEVDSFSTFTVIWNAGDSATSTGVSMTFYFDEVDQPDLDPLSGTVYLGCNNEFIFDDSLNGLLEVDGYSIDHASITITSTRPTSTITYDDLYSVIVTYNYSGSMTYTYNRTNGSSGTFTASNTTISIYYLTDEVEEQVDSDFVLEDHISEDGHLYAVYTGEAASDPNFEGDYYYRWFRLDSESDNAEWEEVHGYITNSFPVYSDSARCYYRVALYSIADDQLIAYSQEYFVPYYDDVRNGSFENPVNNRSTVQYTDNLYSEMVWRTTGFGSLHSNGTIWAGQDIEIINTEQGTDARTAYGEPNAADADEGGVQYAELNCETAGTLYQDILTAPGTTVYWSLAHEARNMSGTDQNNDSTTFDTMCVIAMDAQVADREFTGAYASTQEALITDIVEKAELAAEQEGKTLDPETNRGLSDSVTFSYSFTEDLDEESTSITLWLITSDATGWQYYSGNFEVGEDEYLTRFLFGAVSTSTGDVTVGNLLDDVSLTSWVPDNTSAILIEKNLEGIADDTLIPAGTFTFEIYEITSSGNVLVDTVSLPTMEATTDQEERWWDSFVTEPGIYYVVETSNSISGYDFEQTQSVVEHYRGTGSETDENATGPQSVNFSVEENLFTAVTFTNSYSSEITIQKVAYGSNNTIIDGAEFTMTDINGDPVKFIKSTREITDTEGTVTGTVTVYTVVTPDDENYDDAVDSITIGSAVFVGLDRGEEHTYTLTETTAPDGYDKLTGNVKFYISDDNGIVVVSDDGSTSYNNSLNLMIENSKRLPNAGGFGTWLYTAAGLVLVGGAVGTLVYRKRRAV